MLTMPRLDGQPFPIIGSLTDARQMPVYVKLSHGEGMWTLLGRSLRPTVRIPGLTRVAVLWQPREDLDYSTIK